MSSEITLQVEAELTALQRDGLLKAVEVVEWAETHPESALHSQFTWDDDAAARQFRIEQARQLIMRVRITYETPDGSELHVRKFVSLQDDRHAAGGFRETIAVLSDAELRTKLLEEARRELQSFRRRYATLTELSEVLASIDASLQVAV